MGVLVLVIHAATTFLLRHHLIVTGQRFVVVLFGRQGDRLGSARFGRRLFGHRHRGGGGAGTGCSQPLPLLLGCLGPGLQNPLVKLLAVFVAAAVVICRFFVLVEVQIGMCYIQ